MKKTALTIAIVLGITLGAMAQQYGGGLFQRGMVSDEVYYGQSYDRTGTGLIMPTGHGDAIDTNATPLGSGIALLVGLGAAYAMKKRSKK